MAYDTSTDRLAELRSIRQVAELGLRQLGDLDGKRCVVVGGAGDLGAAATLALAAAGADVVVASRSLERCEAVCSVGDGLPGALIPTIVDVTDIGQIDDLFADAERRLGGIDVAINAMGVNVRKPAVDVAEEEWDLVLGTNLKGVFFGCQAAYRVMSRRGFGKIINVASVAGVAAREWPTTSVYGTSKAGVIHLTRYLAAEWAGSGITVNAMAPGYFLTALTRPLMAQEGVLDRLLASVPMRRLGEMEEFVGPVLFLASEASNFMTGHTLVIDGGRAVI